MAVTWDPSAHLKNVKKEAGQRMLKSVLVVENKAKRRCPKITGRLASSITHAIDFGEDLIGYSIAGGRALDGTNVEYAKYVELGTKHFAGRFYMLGSLRNSYPEIRRIWGI